MEGSQKDHEKSEELGSEYNKVIYHVLHKKKGKISHKPYNILHHAEDEKKEEVNYKPYMIIMFLVFLVLAFNQYMIFSLPISVTGSSIGISSRTINLGSDASIQEIAAAVLPSEEDKIRPFSVNGQPIELTLDKRNILMKFDPFPPNGGRGRQDVPKDLTSEQQKIYADLMYGTQENNFKDAVGGCLFCNAPGGAGGCFKKGTIRGLTTLLLKQGYTKDQIEDELRVWMAYFFPGMAVKWAKYYLDQGLDPSTIPIDVQTFSRNGKLRVEAALGGQDISSVVPDQVGGCF
ncbi:MAG: hypothetical protein IH934_01310 [Nanoarchaeota archaeon]|nr:hypothetical protein [Nanoarchaeota archaeon]